MLSLSTLFVVREVPVHSGPAQCRRPRETEEEGEGDAEEGGPLQVIRPEYFQRHHRDRAGLSLPQPPRRRAEGEPGHAGPHR